MGCIRIRYSKLFCVYHKQAWHTDKNPSPLIRIYIYRIYNRITLKIKTRYYLELSPRQIMKLLGSSEKRIIKNKNVENNGYQHGSRVFYTFTSNEPFGSLIHLSHSILIFLETFKSDQNSEPLELKDRKNLCQVINWKQNTKGWFLHSSSLWNTWRCFWKGKKKIGLNIILFQIFFQKR